MWSTVSSYHKNFLLSQFPFSFSLTYFIGWGHSLFIVPPWKTLGAFAEYRYLWNYSGERKIHPEKKNHRTRDKMWFYDSVMIDGLELSREVKIMLCLCTSGPCMSLGYWLSKVVSFIL